MCGKSSNQELSNKIIFKKQPCTDNAGKPIENCSELVKVYKDFPMCPFPSISKKVTTGNSKTLKAPKIIKTLEKPYVMGYPLAIEYKAEESA